MKRTIATQAALVTGALVLGFAVRAFAVGSPSAEAAAGAPGTRCTAATLNGAYGGGFQGETLKRGRYASVSLFTFDGRATFSASENYSLAGKLGRRSLAGTYQVNTNCRASLRFPSRLGRPHRVFGVCVIVDGGNEFTCLDNEEGWIALGVFRKV